MSKFKAMAVCLALACALTISAGATTIIVSNTNDNGPGSLRQALADANDGDMIDATGISGVITLTTGELLVDKSVTINGAGADVLAIDGNATSRVFQTVTGAKTVSISGLTIRNGQGAQGGGIENAETVTLTIINSTLSGNTAGLGGGVFNSGTLIVINSTFSSNMASQGGGIYNSGSGTLTISNSTFSGNAAQVAGGASFNIGTLQIANTTLSDNSSPLGGGVFNIGTLQIGNSILNAGASGANIANDGGVVRSLGYNVSNDDGGGFLNGPGDQINTDPILGPLQNNGGHTFTHELLSGSPAIDASDPNFTPPPFFDQRGAGFDRVVNGRIDIGSFEVQLHGPVVTNTNDSGPGSLRQALVDANDGDTIDATGISGTITLTSGELLVAKSLTINGPG
ncbi:MAG TPA: choice-of-anchor Q domain-containing protein, partial [Candidatus Angelobacter sp.]|nr:choice-of-anchor Q domain-containing protein [Candidatus Angelobacter sp.]